MVRALDVLGENPVQFLAPMNHNSSARGFDVSFLPLQAPGTQVGCVCVYMQNTHTYKIK